MKMRSILLGMVLGMAAGSIAFAEPDPAYADQMAQQAKLTASVNQSHQQMLHLADGSVLTYYKSNMQCRRSVLSEPAQKVAWHPC